MTDLLISLVLWTIILFSVEPVVNFVVRVLQKRIKSVNRRTSGRN